MDAERENFYILLDLDPSVDDLGKIEDAIRSKRNQWAKDKSTSPSQKRKRQAEQNLPLLPEIERVMRDPELRRKESEKAVESRKATRQEGLEKLRDDIRFLIGGAARLLKKDFDKLVKQYASLGFTEDDIRREIPVEIRAEEVAPEAKAKALDPTTLKDIEENLDALHCDSLYQFLGLGRGAGCRDLLDKADEEYKQIILDSNKARIAPKQDLVAHCKRIFRSEETRLAYDQSLQEKGLRKIDDKFAVLGRNTLDSTTVQLLVQIGTKSGVTEARCLEYIRDIAKKRGMIPDPSATSGEERPQCGYCKTLNQPKDEKCHECGQPLQVICPMPKCRTKTPSIHPRCTGCGFPIRDFPEIQRRLARAGAYLDSGDLGAADKEAQVIRRECLPQHPQYPLLEELVASISKQQRSRTEVMGRLRKLVDDSLMEEASRLLVALKGAGPISGDLSALQDKIGKALTQAEQDYKAAIDADTRGRRDDAFSHCCRALAVVHDYRPARQLMAKFPPEAPSNLEASAERIISLSWKPSPSQGALEYRIVRKEGARPSSPADGQSLAVATANRFDDTTAEPGATYYYAVVTVRAGVESTCCLTGPLMSVADVADLSSKAGDKCVEISWQLPKRAGAVEVWRQNGIAPTKRGQGDRIDQARRTGITDHNVTNGVSYGYLVVAVFRAADGSPRASRGVSFIVRPESPALPLMDLTARRNASQVLLHWQPPSHGTVEVYRFAGEPTLKIGQQCDMDAVSSLGKKLSVKDRQSAEDELHGETIVYYLPVTVTGSIGVIGRGLYVTTVDDIADLKITFKDTMMLAKWKWPRDCRKCRVVTRSDQFATGPEDAQASGEDCLLSVYETKGGFYASVPLRVRELFITVYAAVSVADQVIYASGSESARRRVALQGGGHKRCELRYHISLHTALLTRQKAVHVTIASGSEPIVLPELCVVAKSRTVPTSTKDGRAIASFPGGQTLKPGQKVTFTCLPGPLPKDTLARLFTVNREADWLILVPEKPRMEIGS